MRGVAIFFVVLGLLFMLPTNWILFLPVAVFWCAMAAFFTWLIEIILDVKRGDW